MRGSSELLDTLVTGLQSGLPFGDAAFNWARERIRSSTTIKASSILLRHFVFGSACCARSIDHRQGKANLRVCAEHMRDAHRSSNIVQQHWPMTIVIADCVSHAEIASRLESGAVWRKFQQWLCCCLRPCH